MSYKTISQSAEDPALIDRVTAATEQEAWNNPTAAATLFGQQVQESALAAVRLVWPVCIAADVEAAYASALAAGNPAPGADEGVVTDGMILANVQAKWPADEVAG
jgi:hypothetical protein